MRSPIVVLRNKSTPQGRGHPRH